MGGGGGNVSARVRIVSADETDDCPLYKNFYYCYYLYIKYYNISVEKCYKIAGLTDDTRKNFTEAITACQQMLPPAKLASIHNYIEQSTSFALFFFYLVRI